MKSFSNDLMLASMLHHRNQAEITVVLKGIQYRGERMSTLQWRGTGDPGGGGSNRCWGAGERETPESVIANNQERLSRGSGIIINTATLLNIVGDMLHHHHPQSWCH